MTCDWWDQDEDSKHGGYCTLWDDGRDCSGTRDNDCCDMTIEEYEQIINKKNIESSRTIAKRRVDKTMDKNKKAATIKRFTPTVGMKVHVVVVGSDGDIVHGTITKVEQLILEETNEVLSEHFPTITLDDGKIVNGMECWWSPVDEDKQNEDEQ